MSNSAHPTRRLVTTGLGLLPLVPFIPGCGGGAATQTSAAEGSGTLLEMGAPAMVKAQAATRSFVHPGMLHTEGDFSRIRSKLWSGIQPWESGWRSLLASGRSAPGTPPNPQKVVIRGAAGENIGTMIFDLERAYQNALHWKLSNDTSCADFAVRILNAWGATLTEIDNTDIAVFLVAGIQGYQWANVAEVMRSYPGWAAADQQRFKDMLLKVFYPKSSAFLAQFATAGNPAYVFASWDLLSMCSIMAIGILCDRRDLYDEALNYFKTGRGNGSSMHSVYVVHPGYLGQYMESGRDQGHATLGIGLYGVLCEMAWNQGDDLYGYMNNRFLMAAEYVARTNLKDGKGNFYTLPFTPQPNVWAASNGTFTAVSDWARPSLRPCWELIYNHYVNRRGLSAPNLAALAQVVRPEQAGNGGDDLGSGTLMFSRDSFSGITAPSGLTAYIVNGGVQLSWWGCFDATGYSVHRGSTINGPFTMIAKVNEPRTYTDHPPSGTWYYQITADRPKGVTGPSNTVRIAAPGELQLALPMNAGSGTSLVDTVGGRNATLKQGTSWGEGHNGGKAAVLDGYTGYIEMPVDVPSQLGDFTFAVWIYWNWAQVDTALFVFGQDDFSYMLMRPKAANGSCIFAMSRAASEQWLTAPALPTGRWVHLAISLQGSDARMYYDGVQVGQVSDWRVQPFQLGPTGKNLLGSDSGHQTLSGRLQDFRVYTRALSVTEIGALAK